MISKEAEQHTAAECACSRESCSTAACRASAAAARFWHKVHKVQWQHLLAVAVVLLSIQAWVMRQQKPWYERGMSQRSCQLLQQSVNSSAVLAGLQDQQQAAAAAAAGGAAPQLHILTIIGSNTPRARVESSPLLQSLPPGQRSRVKVLQADTRMGHALQGFGAYGAKIIELYKYVSDSSIPPTDLVLLTDAFDVVMDAQAIASIPDRFAAATNSSSSSSSSSSLAVLFAAERACWPDITRWSCYPQLQHTPYRYLNAGGLLGHVGYLRALLQPFIGLVSSWTDDQRFYTTAYLALREQNGFHIDSGCEVFQTLNQVDLTAGELVFYAERGGWFNVQTNSYPVLVHGNGDTKDAFFREILPKGAGGWHWLNSSQTR